MRNRPNATWVCVCALIAAPAVVQAQTLEVRFRSETSAIPGNLAGDTALLAARWGDWRDLLIGTDDTNNGLYGFLPDGGPAFFVGAGAIGGVDAVPRLSSLADITTGGVITATATTLGRIYLFTTIPDGGLVDVAAAPLLTSAPRHVALADFDDDGAHLFFDTGFNRIEHWTLSADAGRVVALRQPPIAIPFQTRGLAVANAARRLYASSGPAGVLEIAPLANPVEVIPLVDAGGVDLVTGVAVYPQRDGGAILLTAVPALDVFRLYRVRPTQAEFLAQVRFVSSDGGSVIRGSNALDVWPGPFGVTDAGALFPFGIVSVTDRASPFGANYKMVAWDELANAVNPPLPIDVPPFTAPPVGPIRVTAISQTPMLPATHADVAFASPRRETLSTLWGVTAFVADGGVSSQFGQGLWIMEGLDSRTNTFLGPLAVSSGSTRDGGGALLVLGSPDAGFFQVIASVGIQPGPTALTSLSDAGALVVVGHGQALQRVRIHPDDAGHIQATNAGALRVSSAVTGVLGVESRRSVFVATSAGLFELNVDDGGTSTLVSTPNADDSLAGMAWYPLSDGGALMIAAVPARDRFRIYRHVATQLVEVGEFVVTGPNGDDVVRKSAWVDVTSSSFATTDAGSAPFRFGALAVGELSADAGGRIRWVDWATLAQSFTPPLPIEGIGARAGGAGGGTAAGPAGGGGRAGGGVPEEPPTGCCSNAPASSAIPGLLFLWWLARVTRRFSSFSKHA
jgi:myo-inositol-hexaphosphate 3-phosphohydrolase